MAKLLLVPTKTTRQHENGTEIEETTPDDFETTVYQEYIKKYIKDTTSLERPIHALYNIVWGQFPQLMQNKLHICKGFSTIENNCDAVSLLKDMRGLLHQIEANTSIYDSRDEAKKHLCLYYQLPKDSHTTHLNNFKSIIDVIWHYGIDVFNDDSLVKMKVKKDETEG